LTSFPIEKVAMVSVIFSAPNYISGVKSGLHRLSFFLLALRYSSYFGIGEKSILFLWSLLVIFLPRSLGFYVARYISNAAAR